MEKVLFDNKSFITSIMNVGAIFGATLVLFDLCFYLLDMIISPVNYLSSTVVLVVGIVIGTKYVRNKFFEGSVSYGRIFWLSLRIVFFAGVLLAFYKYLLCRFFDPDYILNFFSVTQQMLEKSQLSEQFLNDMLDQFAKEQERATPFSMAQSDLTNKLVWGALVSLVTSIWLRRSVGSSYDAVMAGVEGVDKNDLPADGVDKKND